VDSLRSATGYDLSSLRDERQFCVAWQIPELHHQKLLRLHLPKKTEEQNIFVLLLWGIEPEAKPATQK
jgi:hypothetical protein